MTAADVLCRDGRTVHHGPDTGEMPTGADSAGARAARLDQLGLRCGPHSVREVATP